MLDQGMDGRRIDDDDRTVFTLDEMSQKLEFLRQELTKFGMFPTEGERGMNSKYSLKGSQDVANKVTISKLYPGTTTGSPDIAQEPRMLRSRRLLTISTELRKMSEQVLLRRHILISSESVQLTTTDTGETISLCPSISTLDPPQDNIEISAHTRIPLPDDAMREYLSSPCPTGNVSMTDYAILQCGSNLMTFQSDPPQHIASSRSDPHGRCSDAAKSLAQDPPEQNKWTRHALEEKTKIWSQVSTVSFEAGSETKLHQARLCHGEETDKETNEKDCSNPIGQVSSSAASKTYSNMHPFIAFDHDKTRILSDKQQHKVPVDDSPTMLSEIQELIVPDDDTTMMISSKKQQQQHVGPDDNTPTTSSEKQPLVVPDHGPPRLSSEMQGQEVPDDDTTMLMSSKKKQQQHVGADNDTPTMSSDKQPLIVPDHAPPRLSSEMQILVVPEEDTPIMSSEKEKHVGPDHENTMASLEKQQFVVRDQYTPLMLSDKQLLTVSDHDTPMMLSEKQQTVVPDNYTPELLSDKLPLIVPDHNTPTKLPGKQPPLFPDQQAPAMFSDKLKTNKDQEMDMAMLLHPVNASTKQSENACAVSEKGDACSKITEKVAPHENCAKTSSKDILDAVRNTQINDYPAPSTDDDNHQKKPVPQNDDKTTNAAGPPNCRGLCNTLLCRHCCRAYYHTRQVKRRKSLQRPRRQQNSFVLPQPGSRRAARRCSLRKDEDDTQSKTTNLQVTPSVSRDHDTSFKSISDNEESVTTAECSSTESTAERYDEEMRATEAPENTKSPIPQASSRDRSPSRRRKMYRTEAATVGGDASLNGMDGTSKIGDKSHMSISSDVRKRQIDKMLAERVGVKPLEKSTRQRKSPEHVNQKLEENRRRDQELKVSQRLQERMNKMRTRSSQSSRGKKTASSKCSTEYSSARKDRPSEAARKKLQDRHLQTRESQDTIKSDSPQWREERRRQRELGREATRRRSPAADQHKKTRGEGSAEPRIAGSQSHRHVGRHRRGIL